MERSDLIGLDFDQVGILTLPGMKRFKQLEPSFEPIDCEPDLLAIARRGWEDRLRSEYVGVMVMRRFHGLLVDLNAPMDLQEVALVMTLQEQQHTRLCAAAAKHLGSDLHLGFSLSELQQARDDSPIESQLWTMIIGTLICGEGVALELVKHCLSELPRTSFCEILRSIARDEVLHAALGFRLLKSLRDTPSSWLSYPGDPWVAGLVRHQLQMMKQRDVVEHDEAKYFTNPASAKQLKELGLPDSRNFVACYHQAIDQTIPQKLGKLGLDISAKL